MVSLLDSTIREIVVFGAALLYDETFDSLKWLFEIFLKAHNGQQHKTFYTDQDAAMGKAVGEVFDEAWHGLCIFHIMQNVVKYLHEENEEKKKEKKKKKKKGRIRRSMNRNMKKQVFYLILVHVCLSMKKLQNLSQILTSSGKK